jgi:hypothetical protein
MERLDRVYRCFKRVYSASCGSQDSLITDNVLKTITYHITFDLNYFLEIIATLPNPDLFNNQPSS